jgi:hypothetical protein
VFAWQGTGLLFGYCVVSGFLVSSAGRDRERQGRMVGLLGESGRLIQEGHVKGTAVVAAEALALVRFLYGGDDVQVLLSLHLHISYLRL